MIDDAAKEQTAAQLQGGSMFLDEVARAMLTKSTLSSDSRRLLVFSAMCLQLSNHIKAFKILLHYGYSDQAQALERCILELMINCLYLQVVNVNEFYRFIIADSVASSRNRKELRSKYPSSTVHFTNDDIWNDVLAGAQKLIDFEVDCSTWGKRRLSERAKYLDEVGRKHKLDGRWHLLYKTRLSFGNMYIHGSFFSLSRSLDRLTGRSETMNNFYAARDEKLKVGVHVVLSHFVAFMEMLHPDVREMISSGRAKS